MKTGTEVKEDYENNIVEACKEAVIQSILASRVRKASTVKKERLSDNPDVGAVFLDKEGNILSLAYRHEVKNFHAEVSALAKMFLAANPHSLDEIDTVVTTLEPCSVRPGNNTFPCVKFLIYLGINQVYIGSFDSAMMVRGRGANYLDNHNISISTFPHEDSRKAIREVVNKEYDNFRKKESDELAKHVNSHDREKVMKAMKKLLQNAWRDVVNPSISDLPKEILDFLIKNEQFNKIEKKAKEELMEFRKEEDAFILLFKVRFGSSLQGLLDMKLPKTSLDPIPLRLKDAIAIHLMISRKDSKFNDKIYFEIGRYIRSIQLVRS